MNQSKVTVGQIIALLIAIAVVVALTIFRSPTSPDVITEPVDETAIDDVSKTFLCPEPYFRPDNETAEESMRTFFSLLSQKDYCKAISYYSGSLEVMRQWNPTIHPLDVGRLWQYACEHNGLNCLPVKDIVEEHEISNGAEFIIRYENKDGSVFKRGPCCGETEGPVVSTWSVLVRESTMYDKHVYLVEEMPPYTP